MKDLHSLEHTSQLANKNGRWEENKNKSKATLNHFFSPKQATLRLIFLSENLLHKNNLSQIKSFFQAEMSMHIIVLKVKLHTHLTGNRL